MKITRQKIINNLPLIIFEIGLVISLAIDLIGRYVFDRLSDDSTINSESLLAGSNFMFFFVIAIATLVGLARNFLIKETEPRKILGIDSKIISRILCLVILTVAIIQMVNTYHDFSQEINMITDFVNNP